MLVLIFSKIFLFLISKHLDFLQFQIKIKFCIYIYDNLENMTHIFTLDELMLNFPTNNMQVQTEQKKKN